MMLKIILYCVLFKALAAAFASDNFVTAKNQEYAVSNEANKLEISQRSSPSVLPSVEFGLTPTNNLIVPILFTDYAQAYPYVAVDNSLQQHVETVRHLMMCGTSLVINSFGVIPAALGIGMESLFSKLTSVRRDTIFMQDLYYKYISIIAADFVDFDSLLSYVPGYSLLKKIISVPATIIQKFFNMILPYTL